MTRALKNWPVNGTHSLSIRHPAIAGSAWFMLPQCSAVSSLSATKASDVMLRQCHTPSIGHSGSHCAAWLLSELQKAATAHGRKIVVITNPCGVHYGPCLSDRVLQTNGSMTLRVLARWKDPLQGVFSKADGACLDADGEGGSIGSLAYRAAWTALMGDLRALNALPTAVGIAVETMPAHFEEPPSPHALETRPMDYVGEAGSHQRMWLAGVVWLHSFLQIREAAEILCLMELSWDQPLHSIPGERLLQASRLYETVCNNSAAGNVEAGPCLRAALISIARPHGRFNVSKDQPCMSAVAALNTYAPKTCAARPYNDSFRAAIEAHTPGVPTIRRREYRAERFDAHPCHQMSMSGPLDCMHSSFGRGAFDGEVMGLLGVLERLERRDK